MKGNNLQINAKELDKFIRNSIYNREYAKFVFSKSIDLIFRNLIEFGKKYKIGKEDLSYLDINTILNFHYTLNSASIVKSIKDEIRKNKKYIHLIQ